jgi:SAM-dependent MidA family methyltransferase
MQPTLPEPTEAEQVHSQRLQQLICRQIDRMGGFMPFEAYMAHALYAPGLGYYSAGTQKFGAQGDFVTAPEISPLFSRVLASQCAEVLAAIKDSSVLEFGPGSGVMAADMLTEFERLDMLPQHYFLLELSADLRQRQQQMLTEKVPHLLERVRWLDSLPEHFSGVVVANELLDAMPVICFEKRDDGIFELGVGHEDGVLRWRQREASGVIRQNVIERERPDWMLPYRSEYCPVYPGWFAALFDVMQAGAVILIDYGYPRREYYHPQRQAGTLLCHYRHRAVEDPLRWPGLQDITAIVDFTAVAEAGTDAGFKLAGYTTQAFFLLGCGLEKLMNSGGGNETHINRIEEVRQVKLLTLPAEMGERFQVIAFTKGVDLPLSGFALQDLSRRL